MGADSAVSWGPNLANHANAKMFTAGEDFVIGCAGSVRFEQTVRFHFKVPDLSSRHPEGTREDWYPMMVLEFVPALRDLLRQYDLLVRHKDDNNVADGNLLVALRGQLFEVDFGFAVCHWDDHIHAIGSGGDVARGALMACPSDLEPDERMRRVLLIAQACNTGVRQPFYLATSTRKASAIIAL